MAHDDDDNRRRVYLQQLYPESQQGTDLHNIDIVLVHGVNGDPVKTWQTEPPKGGQTKPVLWPRDLLPKHFPDARVLSFGYNGDMYQNDSIAGIRDLAKSLLSYLSIKRRTANATRPILFIAHCLGGLIVKQALHTAHYERDYKRIAEETKGVFFFGTPHLNSRQDKWDRIVESYSIINPPSRFRRRSKLVKILQRDSDAMVDLMNKFRHLMVKGNRGLSVTGEALDLRYVIVNFYETEVMKGAGGLIVDKTAAQLFVAGEIVKAAHADHVSMCRFKEDGAVFEELCHEIEKIVLVEEVGGQQPQSQNVDWSGTDRFGRRVRIEGKVTVESNGSAGTGRVQELPGVAGPKLVGYQMESRAEEVNA
ncbi:hypothetical protein OQA88_2141 [Cercophora sp. LCS_1]